MTSIDDAAWDSPWRHRHVAEKLLLSLGLVLTALLAPTWPGCLLVALASIAVVVGSARIPPRVLGWAALAPMSFLIMGGVAVAISIGEPSTAAWWSWGPFSVSAASVGQALRLVAHGVAGTLAVLVLATTTPMVDMLTWLRSLRVPDALLEIASLTYRLLFVVLGTALGVRDAQRNRLGDDPIGPGAFKRRWQVTASLVGIVALRSWDRAARLSDGLELRGYESQLVTLPRERHFSWPFIAGTLASLVGIWTISVVST